MRSRSRQARNVRYCLTALRTFPSLAFKKRWHVNSSTCNGSRAACSSRTSVEGGKDDGDAPLLGAGDAPLLVAGDKGRSPLADGAPALGMPQAAGATDHARPREVPPLSDRYGEVLLACPSALS